MQSRRKEETTVPDVEGNDEVGGEIRRYRSGRWVRKVTASIDEGQKLAD